MSEKHIYFMRPVGQIGPIKIGCSRMPFKRLEMLSIVSPLRLEIIATTPGDHATERRLHGMFASDWLHHEWFAASKGLLAIVEHVTTTGELPALPEGKIIPLPRPRRARVYVETGPSRRSIRIATAARSDYELGMGLAACARKYETGPQTLRKAFIAIGVKLRSYTVGRPRELYDLSRALTFRKRRASGESLAAIGKDYGLSRQRVHQVLNKLNELEAA
jgi:hypothetical protein